MSNLRTIRPVTINTFMAVCLLALAAPGHGAPQAEKNRTFSEKTNGAEQEFLAALTAMDAAQLELQQGNAAAYKAFWSRGDDVTLVGGFGGAVEKGWERVSQRLDWAAAQFSKGTNTIERVITRAEGTLGYIVQIEHIRFQVPGQNKEATRDYRVTMLFRREPEGWKIVHRHADSQMMKQAP